MNIWKRSGDVIAKRARKTRNPSWMSSAPIAAITANTPFGSWACAPGPMAPSQAPSQFTIQQRCSCRSSASGVPMIRCAHKSSRLHSCCGYRTMSGIGVLTHWSERCCSLSGAQQRPAAGASTDAIPFGNYFGNLFQWHNAAAGKNEKTWSVPNSAGTSASVF
jgi:hypothetical protein